MSDKYIRIADIGIGVCNPDVFNEKGYAKGWNAAVEIVMNTPAANVRPIIKAHWHDVYMTGPCSWAGTCSHCGQANDIPPPRNAHYCPNCGAQMSEAST